MIIGYIRYGLPLVFNNGFLLQWQKLIGTADFNVSYALTFNSFAIPIRSSIGSSFSDDGTVASKGHVAIHTVVYNLTLSGCYLLTRNVNNRTGINLIVLGY